MTRFLGVRFGETVVSGSNSFLSFRPFFLLYSVLFCIVGYWEIFCFFVSICLLISNENSLLVFGFSACFCLCLPALFSALFQRRFRERKVVLPNRLSGRFFIFLSMPLLFYSLFRYLNKFYLLSLRPQTERK